SGHTITNLNFEIRERRSVSIPVSTASPNEGLSLSDTTNSQEDDFEIPPLEDIHEDTTDGIFTHSSYDDEGAEADFTNLETVVNVSPIPTSRINPSHPSTLILGDPTSAKISEALEDESWVDAMQEELLQFEIQKVWILVDLPYGKKAIVLACSRDSTFDLESYSDSDYAGANLDRKSTTGGQNISQAKFITPLFDTMLVQPTQDEGASSERLSDEQPSPSPAPTSEAPNESLHDSSSAQPSEVPYEKQPDHSPSPSPKPSPTPSPTHIVPDSIPEPNWGDSMDHSSNDTSPFRMRMP
ncbi:hypothetical protein Tco_0722250, partial [Tanacetum coccineum]